MPTPRILKLGSQVTYTDTKGNDKLAFIIGTSESVTEGTSLPVPNEGQFHISVWSPSGRIYPKASVPLASTVKDNDGYKNEDGKLIGVLR
jgi:hypothetical protein